MATVTLPPEYLVGLCLIEKLKENKNSISFTDITKIRKELQKTVNERDADVWVMEHSLSEAILRNPEYYELIELDHELYAKCAKDVNVMNLEVRFSGFTPFIVLQVFSEVYQKYQKGELS